MQPWFKSGTSDIVMSAGAVVDCANCPCGSVSGCGGCAALPAKWTLTLNNAGTITNNGCSNCVSILGGGGPWTLSNLTAGTNDCGVSISDGCFWTYPDLSIGCNLLGQLCPPSFGYFWELRFFLTTWTLELDLAGGAILTFSAINEPDFNCLGVNTFINPVWNGSTCADGGLTATITPV